MILSHCLLIKDEDLFTESIAVALYINHINLSRILQITCFTCISISKIVVTIGLI